MYLSISISIYNFFFFKNLRTPLLSLCRLTAIMVDCHRASCPFTLCGRLPCSFPVVGVLLSRLPSYTPPGAACPTIFILGPLALLYSHWGRLPCHTHARATCLLTLSCYTHADCLFHYTRTLAACPGTLASRAACPVHSH